MKLATDIFDEVMTDEYLSSKPEGTQMLKERNYWRQVLRLAALCHDIGHLPFSHTLEGLLIEETQDDSDDGKGKNHEDLSKGIIEGELKDVIESISVENTNGKTETINSQDVSIIAMGEKKRNRQLASYSDNDKKWVEEIAEFITSDFFGADRMDYLIRDAYHAGVPYGKVDISQLCRSVIYSIYKNDQNKDLLSQINSSNISEGNIAILTSFLMSRQLMYSQVYQHPVSQSL